MAWKMGIIFRPELEVSAREGTMARELYDLVFKIFSMIKMDTQEIEGINSLVKRCVDMAPSISPGLLSARMVTKKNLQVNYPTAELRETLVRQCTDAHKDTKTIYDNKGKGRNWCILMR
jgi:hypothetical protein